LPSQVEIVNGVGMAMGNYDFVCATTGAVTRVEYTFNYKKCRDGKVRAASMRFMLRFVLQEGREGAASHAD
jgi:hypothetical protein